MNINRIINIVSEEMMSTDPGKTGDAGFSSKSKIQLLVMIKSWI